MVRLVFLLLTRQGVDPATVEGFLLEASAKVKAMNPGKGAGRQNHPFSDPADFDLLWTRPTPV